LRALNASAGTSPGKTAKLSLPGATVLVVDEEAILRAAIADYLRDCGYRVLETANSDEAIAVLQDVDLRVDVVLSAVETGGRLDGFGLSRWVREHHPQVDFILAGTPARAVASAADLCEAGPDLARPYDPQIVHDRVKRLLAGRKSGQSGSGR
jgi:DNA-binding response OmpR family regulator